MATLIIFLIGKFRIFPNWVFERGSLREDATRYLDHLELLSWGLYNGNSDFLYTYAEQIHLRIYALAHFVFSGLVGSNILCFEIINLPLFLGSLYLTYKIGEIVFDRETGCVAAYFLMFFPSFVLHTTQPLRDLFFIDIFLLFIFLLLLTLKKSFDLRSAVYFSAGIFAAFASLWFIRDRMLLVYLGIILIAFALVLFKNIREKWNYKYNFLPIIILLISILIVPRYFESYLPEKGVIVGNKEDLPRITKLVSEFSEIQQQKQINKLVGKINYYRYSFSVRYTGAGSNIDADRTFNTLPELLMYVPKATAIGLVAPFPNSWLGEGLEYGKTGRIIAGVETAFMYLLMLLSIFAIFRKSSVSGWFVVFTILTGVTAIGLVVTNVGAIYRMRYAFWFLILVFGAKGALQLIDKFGYGQIPAEKQG